MKRLIKNPLVYIVIVVSVVIGFKKFSHLSGERDEREALVTFLSLNAHGLVLNADCALEEPENVCEDSHDEVDHDEVDQDVIGVSLSGINHQLRQLLNFLEGTHFQEFYSTINFVFDDFWDKLLKYDEEGFDELEFAYVRELRDAFQEFRDSLLQNEDGTLKKGATNETYYLEQIQILTEALNQLNYRKD